jgi:pimeloyl-ACP methyl ester carboxylesterase
MIIWHLTFHSSECLHFPLRFNFSNLLFVALVQNATLFLFSSSDSKDSHMKTFRLLNFLGLLLVLLALRPQQSWSQQLLQPSGKFRIGYHRLEWTDNSRKEILAADNSMRQVVADVWYPAQKSSQKNVPYLDTLVIGRAFGSDGLESLLGLGGAELVKSGKVQTHAQEDAAFDNEAGLAPVIFLSHGMGMITQLYTAQIEELASHGYIVVALSHPYDAWLVSLKDGRLMSFDTKERAEAGSTEVEHIAYENKRLEWWAADIRFAVDQLVIINRMKNAKIPFAGHMDLTKVGAMGHSAGGRAAARACQLDDRIKSCADQDGVAMMQPFYLGPDSIGMKQPFLLFERVRNVPPDEADAASMSMTLPELLALVKRLRKNKEIALASTGGSYHVLLQFDSSSHMSFSDLPILQAKTAVEAAAAYRILQVTCRYTREFFDKTLKKIAAPLFEGRKKLNYIDSVQRYP